MRISKKMLKLIEQRLGVNVVRITNTNKIILI